MGDGNANTSTNSQVVVFGWREHIRRRGACTELPRDNAAGEGEERALGRDTRHGTTEHGMVWVGRTLEIGWAVGRDTFH